MQNPLDHMHIRLDGWRARHHDRYDPADATKVILDPLTQHLIRIPVADHSEGALETQLSDQLIF